MPLIKETLDQHPVLSVLAIIIAAFSAGFGAGVWLDDAVAKIFGKVVLTDEAYAELSAGQYQLAENEVVISKNDLEELRSRPEECPILNCPSIEFRETPLDTRKPCIPEKDPAEVANSFEDYNTRQNEQLLSDHYYSKWVCSPGWEIVIADKPKRDMNQYWRIHGSPNKDSGLASRPTVYATLTIDLDASAMKEGDSVYVTGRVVDASQYSIDLRDASFKSIQK